MRHQGKRGFKKDKLTALKLLVAAVERDEREWDVTPEIMVNRVMGGVIAYGSWGKGDKDGKAQAVGMCIKLR